MGYDVRTHMKHYCQWTDEAGLDAAFDAANAKLNESLTKRQYQMATAVASCIGTICIVKYCKKLVL